MMNIKTYSYCKMILHNLMLCFCIETAFLCIAAHSIISSNQTLTGDQTIVSSNGIFELGFFTPGKSSKYYLGIWYKNITPQTQIWVANRDTPITNKYSSQLIISDDNLVLLNESHIKIWSTDHVQISTSRNSSVIAVLLDNGNLVLRQGPSFGRNLWESFDNPTDTWMPGGKMGYNRITQKRQLLISWKNSEDPSPGLFTHEAYPNGDYYISRWNKSEQYWSSGSWNGHGFDLVPEMGLDNFYNFSYVDNANETYFTYWLYDTSILSRYILDVSGQVKQFMWVDHTHWTLTYTQPKEQCDVYGCCGAFGVCSVDSLPFCDCLLGFKRRFGNDLNLNDYSGGCVREINLECESNGTNSIGRRDRFLISPNLRLTPQNSRSMVVENVGECEYACLSNCSCVAYAYEESRCFLWYGVLLNLQKTREGDNGGRTIFIRLSASSSVFSHTRRNKWIVIGAIMGSFVILLVIMATILGASWGSRRHGRSGEEGSLVAFGYKDLQNATKKFSIKLGGGGFGFVYKGILPDSSLIAVKKLESVRQGEKQFRTEVSTLGTIHHMNLVRLRGFCTRGDKKSLVYDYMENGSLDSHLFNANESKVLDWSTRYKIALGIARGLTYLHEKCRDCIIHCDIKPENILLDADFCPKVGDFGLAKLVGHDFSRVLTTMRGTRGYLAPEWISGVAITTKADVYSFGMMLFEIVSGRRNLEDFYYDNKKIFFPCLAARVNIDGGDVLGILDPLLDNEDVEVEEVSRICRVACWCIQDDENIRPSMGRVVGILEQGTDVNEPPMPRSLQLLVAKQEHVVFFTNSSSGVNSLAESTTSSASSIELSL